MCVAVSRDGSYLFGGAKSGKVYVWALGTGVLLSIFSAHYREVSAMAVSSCGALLATGGDDGVVHVWNVSRLLDRSFASSSSSQTALHTHTAHGLRVTSLHFFVGPAGSSLLLSSSLDSTVKIWRDSRLACDMVFPHPITATAVHPAETSIFIGTSAGTVWKIDGLSDRKPLEPQMAFADEDAVVEEEEDGGRRKRCKAHAQSVTALLCIARGTKSGGIVLVSGGRDGMCHVWDGETLQQMGTFQKHGNSPIHALSTLHSKVCAEGHTVCASKLQKFIGSSSEGVADGEFRMALRLPQQQNVLSMEPLQQKQEDAQPDAAVGETEKSVLRRRIADLESQVEQMAAANQKLYEMSVEKLVRSSSGASVLKKRKVLMKGRYFERK